MLNGDPHSFLYRSVAFVVGVSVIGIGAMHLLGAPDLAVFEIRVDAITV